MVASRKSLNYMRILMKMYVGVTDDNWFKTLKQSNYDEVNFWKPGGRTNFGALEEGELFLFKLHSPQDYIVGGVLFLKLSILPSSLAREAFGIANGANSLTELNNRFINTRRPIAYLTRIHISDALS